MSENHLQPGRRGVEQELANQLAHFLGYTPAKHVAAAACAVGMNNLLSVLDFLLYSHTRGPVGADAHVVTDHVIVCWLGAGEVLRQILVHPTQNLSRN